MAAEPERALPVLVAVSGGGLTRADLLALTGSPPDELDVALAAASDSGLGRAPSRWTRETVHAIADAGQRQRVTDAAGDRAAADCVAALHAWAESYRAGGWPDNTPEYLLDGYFRLLESTGDVPSMTACGTDRARHARLRALTGGDAAAVREVTACQAALAAQDNPDLPTAAVLAVLREDLTGRNDGLPTSLPATLAAAGDPIRAEQLARSFTAPARRTAAFGGLALALLDEGHLAQARHTIGELVAAVGELDVTHWELAKDAVARFAAAGQWTSAERIARAAPSRSARLDALRALVAAQIAAGHLDQAEHLALTLTSGEGATDGYRGDDTGGADRQALASVIGALAADGQGGRAESLARAFPDPAAVQEYGGMLALPQLTRALAANGQDEQFDRLVRAVPYEQLRTNLLTDAVSVVGNADRAEELARSITWDQRRAGALQKVVVKLLMAGDAERAQSLARAIDAETPAGGFLQPPRKPDRSVTDLLLDALGRHVRPEIARALVEQGHPDLAESLVRRSSGDRESSFYELGVALAESGDTARAERVHAEQHHWPRSDDLRVPKTRTHAHLIAGDLERAVRTAYAVPTPHRTRQLLCDIVVWLVENGMTTHAERLTTDPEGALAGAEGGPGGPLDSGRDASLHQTEMLAAAAAAAAAEGDVATARRLALRAAEPPRTTSLAPLRLLLLAEALVEAQEYTFARQLTERAVVLVGTSNDVLLSRAAIILARARALSRAEELARSFTLWSHREPALEAVALAYAAAGDVARAQSVVDAMSGEHRARAMAAVATASTRVGDRDRAREVVAEAAEIARGLSYGKGSALLAVIGALLALGDVAGAEREVGAIIDYDEQEVAQNAVHTARTEPGAGDAPRRSWQSADPGGIPTVIAEAAKWLKDAGDEAGAAQLLADAAQYARVANIPGDGQAADTPRNAGPGEAEPPAWMRQLLARALCGIGRYWDFVLPSLAALDRTAPLAVAETLGLDRPQEPGAATDDAYGVVGEGSAPRLINGQPERFYAGLTADQLIDRVVLCRRAGRTKDPDLRVVLDELRRDHGHGPCPFAAYLESLAYGTHDLPLFPEGMRRDEMKIVIKLLEQLTGGAGKRAP